MVFTPEIKNKVFITWKGSQYNGQQKINKSLMIVFKLKDDSEQYWSLKTFGEVSFFCIG